MSAPVATSQHLALLLGTDVDQTRGDFLIGQAQGLCEGILSPLPASASGIVLRVAARAYTNPNSATQIGMGSAYASLANTGQGGVGGLFLSRADKADLRRLAGRAGAFSISMLSAGASEIQRLTIQATAGTFTLTFYGETTAPLPFDVTAAPLQAALESMASITPGNVRVDDDLTITFRNGLANRGLPQLVVNDSGLTGFAVVTTLQQGQPAAGYGRC